MSTLHKPKPSDAWLAMVGLLPGLPASTGSKLVIEGKKLDTVADIKALPDDHFTPEEKAEMARQRRNAYTREWRARNKDRVKEWNAEYWAKFKQQLNERDRQRWAQRKADEAQQLVRADYWRKRYAEKRDEQLERAKSYYAKNREAILARRKARYQAQVQTLKEST